MLKDKKDEHTRGQLEQRARFKVGIDFATSLTKAQRDFIKSYMAEAGIRSPDGLPTTWYSFAKKIAMTKPVVEIETEATGEAFSAPYGNWNYRKPITLSNSGTTLSNYQVLITLTPENFTYAKCKNDGSDIRFSQNDKTTPLSYWIEDWNYNGTSKLWAKVNSIPPGQNIAIYLYYGNNAAESESNGDNTFNFFDDFPGTSLNLDKWVGDTSYATVSNSILTYVGSGTWKKMRSTNSYTPDMALRVKGKLKQQSCALGYEKSPCCNGRSTIYNTGLTTTSDGGNTQETTEKWSFDTEYIFDLLHKSGSHVKLYVDGILKATHTTHVGTIAQPLHVGSMLTGEANATIVDWYLQRKYTDPEPTDEFGEEEISAGKATLKAFTIHHPAIKSYEILDNGPKEEGISNLEDHISTVVTRSNLNLAASKIVVKTLANQEYEFIVK
jgi:hypothetical protein